MARKSKKLGELKDLRPTLMKSFKEANKHIHYVFFNIGIDEMRYSDFKNAYGGKSFFIFDQSNCFRETIIKLVDPMITDFKWFENLILLLICISTINLAFESPLDNPNSKKLRILTYVDYVITGCFFIEMVLSSIAFGFLFNGKSSYLRSVWNCLDFFIVVVSLIGLIPGANNFTALKAIRVVRILKVLRPLRFVQRNRGLKIALTALYKSIPDIANL